MAEPTPRGSFEGCWEGRWVSEASGHEGGLRALVSHLEEDRYRVRYHATYTLGFLPLTFSYSTTVNEVWVGDGSVFTGSANLGMLAGGVYRYDGECRGGRFFCRYESSLDHGRFELFRVDDPRARPATE